jgi:hypothetical protein
MKQLLLLLFLSLTTGLMAQNVTVFGYCFVKGRKPAAGVKIELNVRNNFSVNIPMQTTTNNQGYYSFSNLAVGQIIEIQYTYGELTLSLSQIITSNKELQELPEQNFSVQDNRGVTVRQEAQNPFEIEKLPQLNLKGIVGLERTLTLTTAATSNNELTSNYNVRGGNYDENLVYVNGFQVFRPFLTRWPARRHEFYTFITR